MNIYPRSGYFRALPTVAAALFLMLAAMNVPAGRADTSRVYLPRAAGFYRGRTGLIPIRIGPVATTGN